MPVATGVSDAELEAISAVSEEETGTSTPDPVPHDRDVVKAQIGGQNEFDHRGKKYHTVDELPALVLIDLGIGSDPTSTPIEKLRALRQFVDYAIVPEERALFLNELLIADPPVKQDELNQLIEKIAPLVTGRPT